MSKTTYNKESGNVLFLILIAVALFAALSYAVTQSTRSGGGNADKETSLLNSASLTQYPASLRTSIIRMVLNGTSVQNLEFNAPADFGALTSNNVGVFHPEGGGAVYQLGPAEVMANNTPAQWHFNAEWTVPQIGLDTAGAGNDIIAFLPDVSQSVCESINDKLNIDVTTGPCTQTVVGIPDLLTTADETKVDDDMENGYVFPGVAETLQGDGGGCIAFSGQPTGCFNDTNSTPDRFVLFSVLLER